MVKDSGHRKWSKIAVIAEQRERSKKTVIKSGQRNCPSKLAKKWSKKLVTDMSVQRKQSKEAVQGNGQRKWSKEMVKGNGQRKRSKEMVKGNGQRKWSKRC